MTSRRTPSLQSPSLGVYCNLAHTLDAIALLPDEAIRAWGQGFDWSQPVERVHVDKAYTRHEAVISGVILVESQNQRLVELLLREDMFERPYGARSDASYLELLETHTTSLVNLTSPNGMLEATLSRALALGRSNPGRAHA